MHDGIGFGTICDLLDLPVAELWKFKHRLENGKAVLAAPPASRNEPLPGLPAADDPLWESLLDGSLGIEMHALGLKLLLTKLREQWAVIGDPEVRALKVQELRRCIDPPRKKPGPRTGPIAPARHLRAERP